ncbi:protocadherin-18 [Heterodontus francisci]|uniref:protocadherin-18 n=1 Tax=Heterodontus francisci TaxID=7792 RepID=UPI00355C20DA
MGQAMLLFCCLVTTACPQDVPAARLSYRQEEDEVRPLPEVPLPGSEAREPAERRRREREPGAGEDGGPAHCRLRHTVGGDEVTPSVADPEVVLVPEGVAANAVIALVEVSEAGTQVKCKLEAEGNFQLLKTYERNYVIVTNAILDREKRAEYSLMLVTEGDGTPAFTSSIQFMVKITDENDNAPVFGESAYRASIMENGPPNTTILTVAASDSDLDTNGQVTYSILDSSVAGTPVSSLVGIHPTSGAIYALTLYDYEQLRTIDFVVEAKDGGHPSTRTTVPVRLDIGDLNDNRPVFTSPASPRITVPIGAEFAAAAGECNSGQIGSPDANGSPSSRHQSIYMVATVKAEDADSGANGELLYELVGGNGGNTFDINGSTGEIQATVCNLSELLAQDWTIRVRVQDRGNPPLSSSATFTLTFVPASDTTHASERISASVVTLISLGALCLALLPILVLLRGRCKAEKRDARAYNCRQAETAYQLHPKRPLRQIQKTDITLLHPGGRSRQGEQAGPASTPPLCARTPEGAQQIREEQVEAEKPYPTLRRDRDSHHHQLLRELVRLSMAGFSECTLELTSISPHVQQISQLLSLLHQGQFQAKPNFRGNKYLKNYRAAMQDADRTSLKDSGQGESEEGDSDCDTGRNSPIDQLLEEGLSDLLARGGWTTPTVLGARASRGEELSLEELCWMLPSPPPSDYKENVFKPEVTKNSPPVCDDEKTTFSTFGKDSLEFYPGTEEPAVKGSLLTEMSALFQLLLSQKAEAYAEPSPEVAFKLSGRRSVSSDGEGEASSASTGGRLPGRGGLGNGARYLPAVQETAEQREGTERDFHQLV